LPGGLPRLIGALIRLMAAYHAAGGSAEHAVMAEVMTRHPAHSRALQTAGGLGRSRRQHRAAEHQPHGYGKASHFRTSMVFRNRRARPPWSGNRRMTEIIRFSPSRHSVTELDAIRASGVAAEAQFG